MNNLKNWTLVVAGMLFLLPCLQAAPSAAEQKQIDELKKSYPLTTCVVSGEKLETSAMGEPVDYLYTQKDSAGKESVRLIRFCCSGCIKKFTAAPGKYLKLIDSATAQTK